MTVPWWLWLVVGVLAVDVGFVAFRVWVTADCRQR